MSAVLRVEDLGVALPRGGRGVPIVEGLNLTINAGEMLALVGESGSGKTIAALSLMRLLPPGATLTGNIWLGGQNLARLPESALRRVRGRETGMVFQSPLAALNPSRTVASQIAEAWRVHNGGGKNTARVLELLGEVGIPNAAARLEDYPHQFSGGQRQRVLLAMALACSPKLLIADEPTSGLDPLIARQIMELIARLRRELNMAVLFVTHDLSVVEAHADAVQVLYAGKSVEWGRAKQFFAHPRHPYSAALLGSIARLGQVRLHSIPGSLPEPESRPPGCRFAPRCAFRQPDCAASFPPPSPCGPTAAACFYPRPMQNHEASVEAFSTAPPRTFPPQLQVRNLTVRYKGKSGWRRAAAAPPSLSDASFALGRGECLGVVGESGSGKSTLGRAVLQMLPYEGQVLLEDTDLATLRGAAGRARRRRLQLVFQDPRESMNPRLRIGEIIAEPLRLQGQLSQAQLRENVETLLRRVGLNAQLAGLYPGSLSGGQAQRAAIARALAASPDIIVLDEPTSSLDVSTQAMLLNLLKDLAAAQALSYILISHDFAVVSYMAGRIAVMHEGRIVEMNDTKTLIAAPRHAYTAQLIAAAPQPRGGQSAIV